MMKKLVFSVMLAIALSSSAFAALKEVVKEATGRGATQHQAISEALLVAVQSVNGATVSPRTDFEETVNFAMRGNTWNYSSKVSPVFNVESFGSGSVTKFQVLSMSGSKNNYLARVRAYVVQYESSVKDQHLRRIAVLAFHFYEKNNRLAQSDFSSEFTEELADALGNHLSKSGQLSLLDRQYIDEMQDEIDFLQWDGAPSEMARIGQKVGVDYLLVGRIKHLSETSSQQMYGLNQGAEQVRLTWRVIEANTSKVVASGAFNRVIPKKAVQSLVKDTLENSSAEILAQKLSQEILVGLKLQSNVNDESPNSGFTPTYEMTPGSSEKPLNW